MEAKAEDKAEELGRDARSATRRASSDIREFGRDVRDSAKEGLHKAENELKKGAKNASKGAEAAAGRVSDAAKDAKSSILGNGDPFSNLLTHRTARVEVYKLCRSGYELQPCHHLWRRVQVRTVCKQSSCTTPGYLN